MTPRRRIQGRVLLFAGVLSSCAVWLHLTFQTQASPYPLFALDAGDQELTLGEVRAQPETAWQRVDSRQLSYPTWHKRHIWLHTTIPKEASSERLVAVLATPLVAEADFYLLRHGAVVAHSNQGTDRPSNPGHRRFIYHTFALGEIATPQSSPAAEQELYLHAASNVVVYLPLRLTPAEQYQHDELMQIWFEAAAFGLYLVFLICDLVICLYLRDLTFVYFFICQICILAAGMLCSGQAQFLLQWTDFGFAGQVRATAFAELALAAFLTLFIQRFGLLKQNDPFFNRLVVPAVVMDGLVLAPLIAWLPVSYAVALSLVAMVICRTLLIAGGLVNGKAPGDFNFSLSVVGMSVGEALFISTFLGLIPRATIDPQFEAFVGCVWQALFLSLIVPGRVGAMKAERFQIIKSLKGESPVSALNHLLGGRYEHSVIPTEMNVSIVFIDCVNFAQISATLSARAIFALLSRLMKEITTIVEECGGTVDRSLGDGVLCFFGYRIRNQLSKHCDEAFTAAVRIQRAMVETALLSPDAVVMPVRIGIHTDTVLIADLGGSGRVDYTMIGNGVNFASRLETACSPFKIMVSAEFHAKLSPGITGFSAIMIAVKHQPALVKAYEYNPFHDGTERVDTIMTRHFEQLKIDQRETRLLIRSGDSLSLKTTLGSFRVQDVSRDGFRVVSDFYIGQKVTLLVRLETSDDLFNAELQRYRSQSLYVEVRWSRARGDGLFEHGVRIIGFNPEQRTYLFERLTEIYANPQLKLHRPGA